MWEENIAEYTEEYILRSTDIRSDERDMKYLEDSFKSFLVPQMDMAPIIQSVVIMVKMMQWKRFHVSTEEIRLSRPRKESLKVPMICLNQIVCSKLKDPCNAMSCIIFVSNDAI